MSELAAKQCIPCLGGVPAIDSIKQKELLAQLNHWDIINKHHLSKTYKFRDFVSALAFVNMIGEIAEDQGHHPNIFLTWGLVRVEIWTHKIDGLTESDFILAAKLDQLKPLLLS